MHLNTSIQGDVNQPRLQIDVVRSGFVESVHFVDGIGMQSDGKITFGYGDYIEPKSLRSTLKPLQVLAMMRHGLPLTGELLALAMSSHSGENFHIEGVRRILDLGQLDENDLQCPPELPYVLEAARQYVANDYQCSSIHMNCSGKHAAMLLTCVINGWPIDSYLEQAHPLQRAIATEIQEMSGEVGVDGCGAPLFFTSLQRLSRAYRVIATSEPPSFEFRVAEAILRYPLWMSGSDRVESRLMAAIPELLIKTGAEGVVALAHRDGRSSAFKVVDGANRAIPALLAKGIRAMGLEVGEDDSFLRSPVLGGGRIVGEIVAR